MHRPMASGDRPNRRWRVTPPPHGLQLMNAQRLPGRRQHLAPSQKLVQHLPRLAAAASAIGPDTKFPMQIAQTRGTVLTGLLNFTLGHTATQTDVHA